MLAGCGDRSPFGARVERVWGGKGLLPGQFVKPRAIAIDRSDRIYIVDFRAIIQVFDTQGQHLAGWETPTHTLGRPSGLAIDPDGNLLVADSHYHRVLTYDRNGKLLTTLGGDEGSAPLVGQFGYIGDIAVDSHHYLYVAESHQRETITRIDPAGKIVSQWGGRGAEPGQFSRVRAMEFDSRDRLFIADACNHRIQVLDTNGAVLQIIGKPGHGAGELDYPYDVAVAPDGTIYVCEYGNHRIQQFDREGKSLAIWGRAGRAEGELFNPWALGVDHSGAVYVVDSNNHRIQKVRF